VYTRSSSVFTCEGCEALYWSCRVAFGYPASTRLMAGRAAFAVTSAASLTKIAMSSEDGKFARAAASGRT
jgi:hypothetical protein